MITNTRFNMFVFLVLLVFFSYSAFAALTTGTITLVNNSDGFDFESNSTNSSNYDIKVVTITGVGAVNNLGFYAPNNYISGLGSSYASVTQIYKAPPITDPYAYSFNPNSTPGYFPIYQVNDGLAVYTSSQNYSVFVVTAVSGGNVTIEYAFQNNGGTEFYSLPTTGCYAYTTETDCYNAQMNGEPCWWDFGTQICQESGEGVFNPTGMIADCFMFDGNSNCQYINGCLWEAFGTGLCDPNASIFDYSNGIRCSNVTNETVCNTISILPVLCSWNSTSNACQANTTKKKSDLPNASYSTCEAAPNQTTCNELISTYFMPCEWNVSGDNTCGMSFTGLFGSEGMGFFDDISTEDGCNAAGGNWITESYSYTDSSTGQFKTGTDSWCEMGFGFGFEDCDDMCWACEDDATGTNVTYAQQVCEASALGFCQFIEDSNAFNGLGWCDMPMQMMWGGGSCDKDCFNCEFMNNPETECNSSAAGCKWVTDSATNQSWCEKKNAKLCTNDCFACYDSTSCTQYGKGGNGTCTWDSNFYFCKPSGFDSEICFDGQDNDNDNKIDCDDPDCGFDSFCGGSIFDNANCGSYTTNATCSAQNASGCMWIRDDFDQKFNQSGHCGMQGEQCWMHQDDNNSCEAENGCSWKTEAQGFCAINESRAQSCFNQQINATCTNTSGCAWMTDPYNPGGGWCEFELFGCHQYMNNNTCLNATIACAWVDDPFMPGGGFCDPFCFGFNSSQCNANSTCELRAGFCEPDMFGGNCFEYDGNLSGCQNQTQCMWMSDPMVQNNKTTGLNNSGWCNDQFSMQMFQGMEAGAPVILGIDQDGCSAEAGTTNSSDICGFGLKDNPKSFGVGILVANISLSAACKDEYLSGSQLNGTEAGKYYYYFDTDGNSTNNCNSSDNNATGFEFKFKYTSVFSSGSVTETKISYQCVNESWGPVPIPLTLWKDKMCGDIGAAIVAVDKEALKKFKTLYNQTKDMMIYVATANDTTDETNPVDNAGPFYYTPGSVDFKMEDCGAPGQDLDGDGFVSENDPDCQDFKKYGFVPIEVGPECDDGLDNDGNGKTDCNDESCKYDPFFCGGNLSFLATDKTSPDITLHQKEIYPDGAKIITTTNEPTNATLEFYGNGTSCSTVNTTITDTVFDIIHVTLLDSSTLGYSLNANTTYVYKIQICDPSDNCAKSGCTNFTTKASANSSDCPQCTFTADFDYAAPNGTNATDPLGNLHISFDWGSNGTYDVANDTMTYGKQINYSQGKNTTILFQNLNSTTEWDIKLKGVDFTSSLGSSLANLSGAFLYNTSNTSGSNNTYLGMDGDKFDGILQNLGVDSIEITIPGTGDNLSHCSQNNLSKCSDITSEAGVNKTGNTSTTSTWEIPVKFGLGFSLYMAAGGEMYILNFFNLTSTSQTINQSQNASYTINLSNGDNEVRVYNITATTTPSASSWINGSSMRQLNFSASESKIILLEVSSSSAGTFNTTVVATLYNDSSVVHNSTSDINIFVTTVNDVTVPQVTAISASSSGTTTVTVTLSVTTDENATCRYNTSDIAYASMTAMSTTGTTNHENSIDYTSDTSGTYYVRCNDTAGNVMTTSNSTAFSADVTESTTTSSGGGGGGGATDTTGLTTQIKKWGTMFKGENSMTVTKTAIAFEKITFDATKTLYNPEITISKISSKPSAVTTPTDTVYQYIEVNKSAVMTSDDVENVKIEFKVEKSWITNNSIDKDTVVLNRWSNDKWSALSTTNTSDDATYVYYQATSSGLSYFSITAKELVVEEEQILVNVTGEEVLVNVTGEGAPKEMVVEEVEKAAAEKKTKWWLWISIFIVIAAAVVGYIFYKKKGEGEESFEEGTTSEEATGESYGEGTTGESYEGETTEGQSEGTSETY